MSAAIIPLLIVILLIYALFKKINVYESFIKGAKEGLPVLLKILPYMAAMLITIQLLRTSGALDILTRAIEKPLAVTGMPPELLPMALLRPLSGSASMAMAADIFKTYGVDSFLGMAASTVVGSSETIFYTLALYFGSIGVRKTRFTLPVALLANFISVMASVMICRMMFL